MKKPKKEKPKRDRNSMAKEALQEKYKLQSVESTIQAAFDEKHLAYDEVIGILSNTTFKTMVNAIKDHAQIEIAKCFYDEKTKEANKNGRTRKRCEELHRKDEIIL